jgi:hypothetical protein
VTTSAFWSASCVAPFGPGYSIVKQDVRVRFDPAQQPRIFVEGEYQLRNTGNQPLSSVELRLPWPRRFLFREPHAKWDNADVALAVSPSNLRNTLLKLPGSWAVSATHTLHLSVEFEPEEPGGDGDHLSFTPNAFFLPAQGWNAELLPARGAFATGGVPPKKWHLTVDVPDGFVIRTSGDKIKTSHEHGQATVQAIQRHKDRYPFVVAGRYVTSQFDAQGQKMYFWTRQPQDTGTVQQSSGVLARALKTYNSTFGSRGKHEHPFWVVECPVAAGCFTILHSVNAKLLGDDQRPSAEMVSADTVMADFAGGAPTIMAAVTPSLAASWMGYGQSPGFFEQQAPLYELPVFAAAVGRQVVEGPGEREATIRRALAAIPKTAQTLPEDDSVLRAKSFLFFYALQDRYGREAFRKALTHMFSARAGSGFDLDDLIAAFGEETHQNVAEFVRLWMKHPGVPDEFRARYENAAATTSSKEATP